MSTTSSLPPGEDDKIEPQAVESAAEFADNELVSPETDTVTDNLTAWDEAPSVTGTSAPRVLPEDEVPPGELLVEEGLDEADREQRIAAEDPDFEP